jgi:hypothetical protein
MINYITIGALFVAKTMGVAAPTVTLPDGTVMTGAFCDETETTRCFFGVPFAQAPVGNLRFAPP